MHLVVFRKFLPKEKGKQLEWLNVDPFHHFSFETPNIDLEKALGADEGFHLVLVMVQAYIINIKIVNYEYRGLTPLISVM